MTAVVVAEAVAIGILTLLVTGLLRTQARIMAALGQVTPPSPPPAVVATPATGLGPGQAAPEVIGVDLDGLPVRLDTESHRVLAFLTSGCASCGWWWQQLGAAGLTVLPGLVVVTPDPGSDSPDDVRAAAGSQRHIVMSSDAWEAYGVRAGSSFVVVGGGRIRAAGTAADWDGLVALVRAAELNGRKR